MRERLSFRPDDCKPAAEQVWKLQGMPARRKPSAPLSQLLNQALEAFKGCAKPRAVIEDISKREFGRIYQSCPRGRATPLAGIYPKARHLALFALTIGARVTEVISDLFRAGSYAEGYLLDSVASAGAETVADRLQAHYVVRFPGSAVLRYSPGYCGWDVCGQRALLKRLRPEEIGITLRESCLMEPLKSISGVFVAGQPEIHRFRTTYACCRACRTRTCRERNLRKSSGVQEYKSS
jgi:hypothetical protein